jgi:hypothetical protein
LTEERGWRLGAQRTLDGHEFTPWAKERGAELSLEGLFWGSHSAEVDGMKVTTFGDHHALPRFGLPDLVWSNSMTFRGYDELEEEKRTTARLLAAYESDVISDVGRVMMALRRQRLDARTLGEKTHISEGKLDLILAFLETADYVESFGDLWQARAVVLGPEDANSVQRAVAIGHEIMREWHEANYDRIRGDLSDLTPIRNGVPFERVYTEIWHFVFGIANRTLVEEGLFADPYAKERAFKGFLPVVWDIELSPSP